MKKIKTEENCCEVIFKQGEEFVKATISPNLANKRQVDITFEFNPPVSQVDNGKMYAKYSWLFMQFLQEHFKASKDDNVQILN